MKNKNNSQFLGAGSLLLSTFMYGFFGVFVRLVGFKIPLFYASVMRNVPMILILGFWIFIKKNWTKVSWQDFKWIFLRAFFGSIGFVGAYVAMFNIPIGLTLFISFAGSTIGGYLIGIILFKEKITTLKIISLLIAILGLFLIYSTNFSGFKMLYSTIAFISGFGTAVWNTFSKKVSHAYSATELNFLDTLCFMGIMLIVSLLTNEKWVAPQISSIWLYLILYGIMFIPTGQLMIYGYKHLNVHLATLIMLTEILFGSILSFLFFHEILGFLTLVGGALIILAIALPEIKWKKHVLRIK
jgi:drug/metabolite transporter (DMT)-like permease